MAECTCGARQFGADCLESCATRKEIVAAPPAAVMTWEKVEDPNPYEGLPARLKFTRSIAMQVTSYNVDGSPAEIAAGKICGILRETRIVETQYGDCMFADVELYEPGTQFDGITVGFICGTPPDTGGGKSSQLARMISLCRAGDLLTIEREADAGQAHRYSVWKSR